MLNKQNIAEKNVDIFEKQSYFIWFMFLNKELSDMISWRSFPLLIPRVLFHLHGRGLDLLHNLP